MNLNRKQRRAEARLAPQAAEPKPPAPAPVSPPPDTRAMFAQAYRLHQAGDVEGASRIYRAVLAINPRDVNSLHLLGVACLKLGRTDEAIGLIGEALDLMPHFAAARANLGEALMKGGQPATALAEYDRALELRADYVEALFGRALALQTLGRLEEAVEAYGQVLAARPNLAEAIGNLGNAFAALGRRDEALATYRRAIAVKPDHVDAYFNLGAALQADDRLDEAEDAYRRALDLQPNHEAARVGLGIVLRLMGRAVEAIEHFDRAIALYPNRPLTYVHLAAVLHEQGQLAEARRAVDHAIALDPGSSEAWALRSGMKTFASGDPDLGRMESIAAGLPDGPARVDIEFALGKAWMDVGDPDSAFAHLTRANRGKRATISYDSQADLDRFERVKRMFSRETMQRLAGLGHASDLPVFVVGMPRSGTTLTEQILASHPQVHGAGELTVIGSLVANVRARVDMPKVIDRLSPGQPPPSLAKFGQHYLDHVAPLAGGKPRLVDKLPGNFFYLGVIALTLTNARIIHVQRDPADTCLSCYATKFFFGQEYSYDLEELGRFYRGYADLMRHWRAVLPPGRMLEVRYEDVVGDLEGQARRMIEFCGLPWDDACLRFNENRRPVRTASVTQVRQPLYGGSVGRWRVYARHLAPLLGVLGDDLVQG